MSEIGESPWSKAVSFSTQASVPDQPEAPTAASSTPTSVTMRWQAPHDNGGPISQYRLERDDGKGGDFELAYTGPGCEALVPGLRSGVPYRFRVWVFNSVCPPLSLHPVIPINLTASLGGLSIPVGDVRSGNHSNWESNLPAFRTFPTRCARVDGRSAPGGPVLAFPQRRQL